MNGSGREELLIGASTPLGLPWANLGASSTLFDVFTELDEGKPVRVIDHTEFQGGHLVICEDSNLIPLHQSSSFGGADYTAYRLSSSGGFGKLESTGDFMGHDVGVVSWWLTGDEAMDEQIEALLRRYRALDDFDWVPLDGQDGAPKGKEGQR